MNAIALLLSLSLALGPAKILDDPKAQKLFDEAQKAFGEKDFATASDKLERAYLIEPAPELLYPWAQAERNLDRCESAIDLYEKFIDTKPNERMVAAAQQNIDRCKEQLSANKPDEPPPVPDPGSDAETAPRDDTPPKNDGGAKDEPKTNVGRDPAGAVLVSLGAAGVIAGAALLGVASKQAKKTGNDGNDNTTYLDMRRTALIQRNAGIAVLTIGGALIVAGAIRYGLLARKQKRADVGVWIDRTSASFSVSARF
jgi:hypothetical protein